MIRYLVLITILLTFSVQSYAQDCDDPQQLCFNSLNNLNAGSTQGAPINGLTTSCFEANGASMFSFETLAMGAVNVTLSQLVFANVSNPNFGDSLQVLLFSASDPCDPATYSELDCVQGTGILTLETLAMDSGLTYQVLVSGQMGALFPASCGFNIQISGDAVESQVGAVPYYIINQGDSQTLEAFGASEYSWSPSSTLDFDTAANPVASPSNSTLYSVETTVGTCTQTFEVFLEVIPGITPVNMFTPNGDTFNDTWRIFAIDQFPNADVRVYSRWGQIVFRSTGYGSGREWTGMKGGKPLPAGSYYYVIDLNIPGVESDPVTGSVAITY
jgi:gliding motility-associated-like protein